MKPADPQSQTLVQTRHAPAGSVQGRLVALVGLGIATWASTCSRVNEGVRREAESVAPRHAPSSAESASASAPPPLPVAAELVHGIAQSPPDARALDIASGPGLRAAFSSAVQTCSSIDPWLQLAELALASLGGEKPVHSASGGWTYEVSWPHSDDRIEVTSRTGLPEDAHLVQIRAELTGACQPAESPVALDGLLQIFLRWKQDVLVECTVMTQFDVPNSAELDDWIERSSATENGSRRKGAVIQCYSNAPSARRTIELRLERTPEGPVRVSRFVDGPPCECSARWTVTDALGNLCRSVRRSHH